MHMHICRIGVNELLFHLAMSILKLKDCLPHQVHLLHLLVDFTMSLAIMNAKLDEIIKI